MNRSAKGYYPVARLKGRGFAKAFDDLDHALAIEHTSDIMGHGGRCLALSHGRKIHEQCQC